jgi:hypothetical protein
VSAANRADAGFSGWRKVTPMHNALVDKMLQCDLHLIATMRTKTAYDVVPDEQGKLKPVKIGLAPIQREGLDYEFSLVLDLSIEGNTASTSKDRTGLFIDQYFTPDEDTGRKLLEWLNSGADPREAVLTEITGLLHELELGDQLAEYWSYLINKYGVEAPGEASLDQLREQTALLNQLKGQPHRLVEFRKLLSSDDELEHPEEAGQTEQLPEQPDQAEYPEQAEHVPEQPEQSGLTEQIPETVTTH